VEFLIDNLRDTNNLSVKRLILLSVSLNLPFFVHSSSFLLFLILYPSLFLFSFLLLFLYPSFLFLLLDNKLTDRSARKLGEFLKYFPLQELHLSFNSIGDEGGRALAETLKTNTTLHTLGLYRKSLLPNRGEKRERGHRRERRVF
jgi:hypothetical protein